MEKHDISDITTLRHSTAHVLAAAVGKLWPEAKFGVGPVTQEGFYYDIDLGTSVSPEDLEKIEKQMNQIIAADLPFERFELPIDEAIAKCRQAGQNLKLELLEELKSAPAKNPAELAEFAIGSDSNVGNITTVSFYRTGDFEDLCKGPHVASTGLIKAYKLTKVSGAYWRADQNNVQLQRIYGVSFPTAKELEAYMQNQEAAKERDHRRLGKELDLFTFSELVGAGLPLYTPRGTTIINALKQSLAEVNNAQGMEAVSIPHLGKLALYQTSGHADKFEEELFRVKGHHGQEFILKPVNCPHHTQIFKSQPRSWRDMPLRYVEQTMQYRDEKPGEIGGLARTRGFNVDDGHIFCRADQIKAEATAIVQAIRKFYENLGLWGDHWVSLSVRDTGDVSRYIGEPADWDDAEAMLAEVARENNLEAIQMPGEAAIYGPKLDFMFKDALGRQTQLATIQLDFAMPKRFGLSYTDQAGQEATPVMIHRAILGSFERFMMLLIEHFAGAFPLWLAPEQVRVATINDDPKVSAFANEVASGLKSCGIRTYLDDENESLGKKIRAAEVAKVNYVIVVGAKEADSGQVRPRLRGGKEAPAMKLAEFIDSVAKENATRTIEPLV